MIYYDCITTRSGPACPKSSVCKRRWIIGASGLGSKVSHRFGFGRSWKAYALNCTIATLGVFGLLTPLTHAAISSPLKQDDSYAVAMQEIAQRGHGRPGVILHVGDSITYANPYGAWARAGKGHTPEDDAALKWMHANQRDDTDGWYLAAFDHPDGGRSFTAAGGMRLNELLAGGKSGLPSLGKLLAKYQPQAVVLMMGTNDAINDRPAADFAVDLKTATRLMLDAGVVPILSTIPPQTLHGEAVERYNAAIRAQAATDKLPLIDFEKEILKRRPNDWDGTLINKGDVHPTASRAGTDPTSEPTAENLSNSGYLLRGWLSVKKIEEVKQLAFDPLRQASSPAAADHAAASRPAAGPLSPSVMGQTGVRCPVTRDTWFSNVGEEADGSNGGASQLKVKSIQEMALLDIDPAPLRGRAIGRAWLHVHLSGKERLHRISISTIAADWVEGTATAYAKQPGSSTFNWRQFPDVPWSFPRSDLTSVILGQGGTTWRMADATDPDEQGWQHVAIDPRIVDERVAGISYGFLVFDDTGSEWTHDGDQFHLRHFPNRYFHSRENGRNTAPFITVELAEQVAARPVMPAQLKCDTTGVPAGEADVSWLMPDERKAAPAIGYDVALDGESVARYLIPRGANPGQRETMRLRDLPRLHDGSKLEVRSIDEAGNRSDSATLTLTMPKRPNVAITTQPPDPLQGSQLNRLARLGGASVAIIDAQDKVQPMTGQFVPPHEPRYLTDNHLWAEGFLHVGLTAARNEIIGFQILLSGPVKHATASFDFPRQPGAPRVAFYRLGYVPTAIGPMPDPLLPIGDGISIPSDDAMLKEQKNATMYVEIEVPRDAKPGKTQVPLTLHAEGAAPLVLYVELDVSDVALPDALGFLPEMNCYGLPANELAYYRIAHRNRTVLNRVPYHHSGDVEQGCAPGWDGKTLDFTEWDKRFGPLFDGSAFADEPRAKEPIECFYLPMFENWPTPMAGAYNESYWADEAFTPAYRAAWVSVSRQFAEHCNAKHWDKTIFQCFLNGKNNFKQRGWSHGTSPWLLDEPANFQDYWALRWFGRAFHQGADSAAGNAMMAFRADVSRPEWQRDVLDSVLDYSVVGGEAFNRYNRIVTDRKRRFGQVVVPYGGTNDLHQSNMQPVGWCLDVWLKGGDGVLPWQTIGDEKSWKKADPLSLFYPGEPAGLKDPVPSIRLKSYLRGEQDVEYLLLLAQQLRAAPGELSATVREAVKLNAQKKGTGFAGEDAGMIDFESFSPQSAWMLRTRILRMLKPSQTKDLDPRWRVPHRVADDIQPALNGAVKQREPIREAPSNSGQ